MHGSFSEDGFLVIRNAIGNELLGEIYLEIFNCLSGPAHSEASYAPDDIYELFCKKATNLSVSEFEFQRPIWDWLSYKGLVEKLLKEPKLYDVFSSLMGKDLSYLDAPSLNLNLPSKDSPHKNYLFKDWHQEVWSGASISNLQIWTPLLQKDNFQGQIELMHQSHKWGHIPHRNRVPTELPEEFETLKTDLHSGDVIVFSTLMLHRSVAANHPRLSLTAQIRNFKRKSDSFQNENINWKIFSYSELTKIERILGNHYLSPFRVVDVNTDYLSNDS